MIGQTANILFYLGSRHGLAPKAEAAKLWVHQLQLTVTDFVLEIHDTHHPLGPTLYYEDQRAPAKKRTQRILERARAEISRLFRRSVGSTMAASISPAARLTYVDLSLFQIVEGLRYAFPKRMKAFERQIPGLVDLHDRVASRPNIKAYLASDRRIAFNEDGIFRHYKELDLTRHPGCALGAARMPTATWLWIRVARSLAPGMTGATCSARRSASSPVWPARSRRCS